jgi:hypothetical protein
LAAGLLQPWGAEPQAAAALEWLSPEQAETSGLTPEERQQALPLARLARLFDAKAHEGLRASRKLQQRWPMLKICLDGFTFQNNNRHDQTSLARSEAVAARISSIQAACPGIDLESLHGLSFEAYLPRVAEASFYITYEGTIQHKIGWFYPQIPGLCLVAGPYAEAIGNWHCAQCEGANQLAVLPTGLLLHATNGDPAKRDQPFECRDPVAMIEAVQRLLAPHLEPFVSIHLTEQ